MNPYDAILASLESVPWSLVPEVKPIRPLDRNSIEFFPGHAGYAGSHFPVGGVMVVGNNFSTVAGWRDYEESPDVDSPTKTWQRLRLMIEASGIPLEEWWFTNYCLGAMVGKSESYDFPQRVIKTLEFERVFAECVAAMRPRLIVSLGRLVSSVLNTDFDRVRIDERTIGGHPTRLIAAVHPSAWTWRGRGFGDQDFIVEGKRIGAAVRFDSDSNSIVSLPF